MLASQCFKPIRPDDDILMVNVMPRALNDRERELFERVWPQGIPSGERVIYEAVDLAQRPMVLDRLEAAWAAEHGVPWHKAAEPVGLKRAALYSLRKGWRENGLSGVIPYDTRRERSLTAPVEDPLRVRASALLRSVQRGFRNVDLAKQILAEEPGPEGETVNERLGRLQRIERIVQRERRAFAKDPDFLRAAYGSGLIVDVTAVSILIDDPEPGLAVIAAVLDEASGLVLGSSLGPRDKVARSQIDAVEDALKFLDRHHSDVGTADDRCDLVIRLAPEASGQEFAGALPREHFADLTVLATPRGSFGSGIVQATGPRIGRIPLAPRSTLAVELGEFLRTRHVERATLHRARALWGREVARHNAPIVRTLIQAGLADGDGPSRGAMANALEAIGRALRGSSPGLSPRSSS